jgi:hypothetical protein
MDSSPLPATPERAGSGSWGGTPTAGRTPATPSGAAQTPVRPLVPGGKVERVTVYCRVRPELNADGSAKAPAMAAATCIRVDAEACQARAPLSLQLRPHQP